MRRLKWIAAALTALVLLAGCNLAANVVVKPDGSGYYSVTMSVPNASSHPGQAIYSAVRRGAASSNVPLTVTPYSSGGNSGAKMTFHFLSLADLNAESQRLAAAGKGAIGVTINRDDHGWNFSASTADSLITPPGSTGGSSALGTLVNQVITINLVVQLPGAPAENNAKAVTHTSTASTFTWILSSSQSGTGLQASTTYVGNQANVKLATALTPVAASSNSSGSSGSGWSAGMVALVAGGAVIVLGAAAFGIVTVTRRRRVSPAVEVASVPEAD